MQITENKHIGINDPMPGSSAPVMERKPAVPLSPNCDLAFDSVHEPHARRVAMTQEEIDTINMGTNECYGWENIKL